MLSFFGCYHFVIICVIILCYHFLLSFPPFFIFVENMTHSNFLHVDIHTIIVLYILEWLTSGSTLRICLSWPRSRVKLCLLLALFPKYTFVYSGSPSILLFVPTAHISHSTPSLLIGGLTL